MKSTYFAHKMPQRCSNIVDGSHQCRKVLLSILNGQNSITWIVQWRALSSASVILCSSNQKLYPAATCIYFAFKTLSTLNQPIKWQNFLRFISLPKFECASLMIDAYASAPLHRSKPILCIFFSCEIYFLLRRWWLGNTFVGGVNVEILEEAVKLIAGRLETEASGECDHANSKKNCTNRSDIHLLWSVDSFCDSHGHLSEDQACVIDFIHETAACVWSMETHNFFLRGRSIQTIQEFWQMSWTFA